MKLPSGVRAFIFASMIIRLEDEQKNRGGE